MKIIDLLNKIANGEEVPRKFKYKDIIFIYDIELREYFDEEEDNSLNYHFDLTDYDILTDEVEILEEEKKIPEKIYYKGDDYEKKIIIDIIDEIIDYLKSKGE